MNTNKSVKSFLVILAAVGAAGLSACSPKQASVASNQNITSDSAIIGGTPVGSDPIAQSTVQIITLQAGKDPATGKMTITGLATCTGTIISEQVVVSAAHCTSYYPQLMFVYFSNQVPSDYTDLFKGASLDPKLRRVLGGMTDSKWPQVTGNEESNWGDISLIKFDGAIPAGFKVAKLLPANLSVTNGMTITLAGYGLTDYATEKMPTELLKVDVSIENKDFSDTEMMIATGNGKSSCHGDSGGPGYVVIGGVSYVAGLTSRADLNTDPSGHCVGKTIYTKTQAYASFIEQGIKTLQDPSYKIQPIPQPF